MVILSVVLTPLLRILRMYLRQVFHLLAYRRQVLMVLMRNITDLRRDRVESLLRLLLRSMVSIRFLRVMSNDNSPLHNRLIFLEIKLLLLRSD